MHNCLIQRPNLGSIDIIESKAEPSEGGKLGSPNKSLYYTRGGGKVNRGNREPILFRKAENTLYPIFWKSISISLPTQNNPTEKEKKTSFRGPTTVLRSRMTAPDGGIVATLPLATASTTTTNTTVRIPQLGLGTYLSPPDRTLASCLSALRAGYRHIDTAQYYGNEEEVGRALAQSGVPRRDVFVTTKILKVAGSVDENYAACLESVDKISGGGEGGGEEGYVDLFLIHSPRGGTRKRRDMWLALERLYEEGKARAIGVSNFGIGHIEELKGVGKVWPPHVNQFEVSPRSQTCQNYGPCTSYCLFFTHGIPASFLHPFSPLFLFPGLGLFILFFPTTTLHY